MSDASKTQNACAICAILDAAQGQLVPVAVALLKVADKVPCACEASQHTPLAAHPHRRAGCGGYPVLRRRVA
jgi:hypothetical protein